MGETIGGGINKLYLLVRFQAFEALKAVWGNKVQCTSAAILHSATLCRAFGIMLYIVVNQSQFGVLGF